jgi:hypothetical protein
MNASLVGAADQQPIHACHRALDAGDDCAPAAIAPNVARAAPALNDRVMCLFIILLLV